MAGRPPRDAQGRGGPPQPRRVDLELWHRAMRDVSPIRARRAVSPADPAAPTSPEPAPPARSPPAAAAARGTPPGEPPAAALPPLGEIAAPGLDKASAERLKRGRYPIEARLDLHGMTQDEAHRSLVGFLTAAARQGRRCVLVITGKGLRRLGEPDAAAQGPGGLGILRNAVPRWLNEPALRPHILAFAAAQPRDGGHGALYILLRRQR